MEALWPGLWPVFHVATVAILRSVWREPAWEQSPLQLQRVSRFQVAGCSQRLFYNVLDEEICAAVR